MAKLADLTSEIRVVLKIIGIAASIVAVLFIVFRGGQFAKDLFFPTPPPPPEERFGRLPEVIFPTSSSQNLDFQINTLDGKLPGLSDRMKVYKVDKPEASLVALDTSRRHLQATGFSNDELKITETVYRWTDREGAVIQYNIITNNFRISSNFLGSTAPTRLSGEVATGEGAYAAALEFLARVGQDTQDIDPENFKSTYLKLEGGRLVEAISQNDAQFIKVELFQKKLDEKNIYYSAQESPMYFIYRNEDDIPKIVDASYFHNAISSESSEYPIKSAEAAFEELKKGNAYILTGETIDGPVDITEVTTGYYIGEDPQYFLPIIVFSGNGITAYVNALISQ